MSLIYALGGCAALLMLVICGARLTGARAIAPILLVLVLGLPLIDSILRTLGLPLFFPGCGYLALPFALWAAARPAGRLPIAALVLTSVVLLGFLLLRGLAPGFDSFGENIFSLRYVQSLRLSDHYPAADLWGASPTVATYYTTIHNLPALLSRALLLPVPFAISLSLALILSTLWVACYEAFRTRAGRVASAAGASVMVGAGSGVSLLAPARHLAADSALLGWPHVRLFGMPPEEFQSPLLARLARENPEMPLELPLHPAIFLGDLHPPLWGFVLMAGLLWLIAHRAVDAGRSLAVALGALPLLAWVGNPWIVPHVGALSLGLLLLDGELRARWRDFLAGGLGMLVALSPLILSAEFRGDQVQFMLLPAALRATPEAWLLVWSPLLALVLAAALRRHRESAWLALILVLALSMEVVLFSQGDTTSEGARFNGTLKVWSVLYFFGCGLGLLALMQARARRWAWSLAALPLVLASGLHAQDVVRSQLNKDQPRFDWSGAGPLAEREDRAWALMKLRSLPPGRTMERLSRSSYDLAPLTSLLAGHETVSGWVQHASQASGDPAGEQRRYERIAAWYHDPGADAGALLREWDVDYVVFDWDAGWNAERLSALAAGLGSEYVIIRGIDAIDGRASAVVARRGPG